MKNLKHEYDVSLNVEESVQAVDRATYFQSSKEITENTAGFDCLGCVGTAGTAGGCAGTFGSFGCCC